MRQIEPSLKAVYLDLLKSIEGFNYEGIEALCEPSFAIELAAKIYEMQEFNGISFKLLHPEGPLRLQVINHFYIEGLSIEREKNPNLKEL